MENKKPVPDTWHMKVSGNGTFVLSEVSEHIEEIVLNKYGSKCLASLASVTVRPNGLDLVFDLEFGIELAIPTPADSTVN